MSDKKSIKKIAILFLIFANVAVLIALVISVKNAIGKIEVGKSIETEQAESGQETGESGEENQGSEPTEEQTSEETPEEMPEEQNPENEPEEQNNKENTLQQVIAQLNNKNTSIVEIVLVLVGIALFVLGVVLIRIVKRMS